MTWLWVFIGGGLGSMLRYGISRLLLTYRDTYSFPWATLSSNLLATALLAYLSFYWSDRLEESQRLFWLVGFCGGFSTFSTFSLENWQLINQKAWGFLAINILLSVALGIFIMILFAKFKPEV